MKPILITLIFVFTSCASEDNEIRIIDTKAGSFSPTNLSEVFSPERMVKLITNDSIIMGNIVDIEVSRGFIFTNELRENFYLSKFSHQGKYIGAIGKIGHGPEEYTSYSNIAFDTVRQKIVLDSYQKYLVYDYNGKYIKTIPSIPETMVDNMIYVGNELWININRPAMNAQNGYKEQKLLVKYDQNNNIVDSILIREVFINREMYSFPGLVQHYSILKSGNYCYFPVVSPEPLLRDTLYRIEGTKIIPEFKLDFSEILITQKDIYGNIDFKEYHEKYKNKVRSVTLLEIYRTNQYVFAKYEYDWKMYYFCYDLKNKKRYNMQDGFTDDLYGTKGTTKLIPINLDKGEFCFVKNGYELEGIIDGINETSNPVVFFIKTKE